MSGSIILSFAATIILAVGAATNRATSQPTPTPATDRTPSAPTSPRDAIKSFRAAMESNDANALRTLTFARDDHERPLARACVDLAVAGKQLADASHSFFGETGEPIARGGLSDVTLALAATDRATLNEAAAHNVATLVLPGRNDRPLTLRRNDEMGWQVDLIDFAGLRAAGPSETPEMFIAKCNMLAELARGFHEIAESTETGRYRTPADLRAAVQDRFHSAVARSLRKPSTQPVTQPSTQSSLQPSNLTSASASQPTTQPVPTTQSRG